MEGVLVPRRRMAGAVRMALLVCAVLLTAVAIAGSAGASLPPVVGGGYNWCSAAQVPQALGPVAAIYARAEGSAVLSPDGTVVAWGDNWYGQCDVPAGLSGVVAIAAGMNHSLALAPYGRRRNDSQCQRHHAWRGAAV